MSKRLLFDRNPLDEPYRERMRREAWERMEGFTHRIATRRRNPAGRPYWDPLWPSSLSRAARELKIEVVLINDGMFTREGPECDSIKARAETIWRSLRPGANA